jgi:hypothetical protein
MASTNIEHIIHNRLQGGHESKLQESLAISLMLDISTHQNNYFNLLLKISVCLFGMTMS